jgi:hypothetical protein
LIRRIANQSDSTGLESNLLEGLLVGAGAGAVGQEQQVALVLLRRVRLEQQVEQALVPLLRHQRIPERPLVRSFHQRRIVFHR